jgi:hypothetical protein
MCFAAPVTRSTNIYFINAPSQTGLGLFYCQNQSEFLAQLAHFLCQKLPVGALVAIIQIAKRIEFTMVFSRPGVWHFPS